MIYCIVLCGHWGSGHWDSTSNLFYCLMVQRVDTLRTKRSLLSTLLIQSIHGLFLFAALRRKTMMSGPKWWGWIRTSRGRRRSLRSWSWGWRTWSGHGRTWRRKTRCLRRRLKNWPNPQAKPIPKPTRSHPAVHRLKSSCVNPQELPSGVSARESHRPVFWYRPPAGLEEGAQKSEAGLCSETGNFTNIL